MVRITQIILVLLILLSIVYAQETLTVTTYYPSPYGVYKTLRLAPSDDISPSSMCSQGGEMYYHRTSNQIYFCNEATLRWQALGSNWEYSAGALYPKDDDATVGIKTDSPDNTFALDVNGKIKMLQTEAIDAPETAVTKKYVDDRLLFEKNEGACPDGSQPVKIKWKQKCCTSIPCNCCTAVTDWVEHDDPPPTCGGGCCVADQYYSVCPSASTTTP